MGGGAPQPLPPPLIPISLLMPPRLSGLLINAAAPLRVSPCLSEIHDRGPDGRTDGRMDGIVRRRLVSPPLFLGGAALKCEF